MRLTISLHSKAVHIPRNSPSSPSIRTDGLPDIPIRSRIISRDRSRRRSRIISKDSSHRLSRITSRDSSHRRIDIVGLDHEFVKALEEDFIGRSFVRFWSSCL